MPNDTEAETRAPQHASIRRIGAFLQNPCKIFVALTHRGWFEKMDDELYLRLLYRGVMGRKLHLNPPRKLLGCPRAPLHPRPRRDQSAPQSLKRGDRLAHPPLLGAQ